MNNNIEMSIIVPKSQLSTYFENDVPLPQNKNAINLDVLKIITQQSDSKALQKDKTLKRGKTIPPAIEMATKVPEKRNIFDPIVYELNDYSPTLDVCKLGEYSLLTRTTDEILEEFWEACYDTLSTSDLNDLPPKATKAESLREWMHNNEGELLKIEEMNLDRKALTSLPPEIGKLSRMTHLTLSNNSLTSLPPEIGNLSRMTHLTLSNNKLTSLPPEIGKLLDLISLELANNKFTTLPAEIGKISTLAFLKLANNKLTKFPSFTFGMEFVLLCVLDLENNNLTTLPAEIGKQKLALLNVAGNPLSSETILLLKSQNIKFLTLFRN